MTTEAEPAATDRAAGGDIAHLRCLVCFPEWIEGGTFAVCGHLFKVDGPDTTDAERCVVCVDMQGAHFVAHYVRGEVPAEDG
ncbi:hypothetical protein [Streptomyces sp. NBC_00687]|uniref:hypothetical protein n=1 Tax=Streptomyces sp. NBC_00687 TaxID=2975807 RepID=UPI0022594484|nr:hypothetical protein [Streptomyces sp. NBC_00687]MCX4912866.1 hypothetical protein [Streptomyces sp. NBC_00687]